MRRKQRLPIIHITLICVLFTAASCGVFRGGRGSTVKSQSASVVAATQDDHDATMKAAIANHIKKNRQVNSAQDAPVIKYDPYFVREYSEYQGSASSAVIKYRDTESRMSPRVADVTLKKIRYVTEMHRKRKNAIADNVFFRETGKETLSFQWRNNRWVQVAGIFIIDKKERHADGKWELVEPAPPKKDILAAPPRRGIFGRIFGDLF